MCRYMPEEIVEDPHRHFCPRGRVNSRFSERVRGRIQRQVLSRSAYTDGMCKLCQRVDCRRHDVVYGHLNW